MNLQQHLNEFYKENDIPNDGGANDKFFDFKVLGATLKLPNPEFRRKILHIHDLEHILYKCDTSWKGEGFIAGWEIGSGIWKYTPINFLSLWAMAYSLWIHPISVFKGFKEGKKNIGIIDLASPKGALLELTPEVLRKKIKKQDYQPQFLTLEFILWSFLSQVILLAPFIILVVLYFLCRS